ncbi:MAG: hypothetical protein ABFR97_06185 [Thermodesulfobacteriota bacterium]
MRFSDRRQRLFLPLIFTLLLLCLAVWPDQGRTGEPASGAGIRARYSQPRGTSISWQIHIPAPPPAAVIVLQNIPPATVIKKSSPPHSGYDGASGTVKWLLTAVEPGVVKMTMELDRPIRRKGEISGKIIFQDSATRPIAEVFMSSKRRKSKKRAIEGC